ncbi:MAG: rhodanese-like domain-containing protein [Candidatus Heimdallarchaeota archaeon]
MFRHHKERGKWLTVPFCILTSCFILFFNVEIAISYTNITPIEVKTALETEDVFLLDVRSESEYLEGHIPGAYLIPHTELEDRKNELPENLSQPIIVYCASGRRSAIAADILDSLGYADVRNMEGGFNAWPYEVEYGSGTTTLFEISRAFNTSYWIPVVIIFSLFLINRKWKKNRCY